MLFDYGIANGMSGFENDYLDYNYLAMPYLRKTHGAANKWLAGINKAALERNLPVQICMALPSDVMATVQFDRSVSHLSLFPPNSSRLEESFVSTNSPTHSPTIFQHNQLPKLDRLRN
jgi:hypothetical protein